MLYLPFTTLNLMHQRQNNMPLKWMEIPMVGIVKLLINSYKSPLTPYWLMTARHIWFRTKWCITLTFTTYSRINLLSFVEIYLKLNGAQYGLYFDQYAIVSPYACVFFLDIQNIVCVKMEIYLFPFGSHKISRRLRVSIICNPCCTNLSFSLFTRLITNPSTKVHMLFIILKTINVVLPRNCLKLLKLTIHRLYRNTWFAYNPSQEAMQGDACMYW